MIRNEENINLEPDIPIVIGRSEKCNFRIPHCYISGNHARIVLREDGVLELSDLESMNGTSYRLLGSDSFVPLERGGKTELAPGSDICFGGIESRFYRFDHGKLLRVLGIGVVFENASVKRAPGFDSPGKTLLENVNAKLEPGSFIAVIGASGSGKSLLMNSVAKTLGGGWISEGIKIEPGKISFVPQNGGIPGELTLADAMKYSALLKYPDHTPGERETIIEEVLKNVELSGRKEVFVRDLSGGQAKRASVAVDLLDFPQLLILDEPTSGLDAATEQSLLELLGKISREEGITVVCITHSLESLELFDKVLFIGKPEDSDASKILFEGKPDTKFKKNVSEQFFRISRAESLKSPDEKKRSKKSETKTVASFPEFGTKISSTLETIFGFLHEGFFRFPVQILGFGTKDRKPFRRLLMVSARSFAKLKGDRFSLILIFSLPILLGLLIGISQRNQDHSLSPCFFLSLAALWIGISLTIREFIIERAIYVRERLSGLEPLEYLYGKLTYSGAISLLQVILLYLPACFTMLLGNYSIGEFDPEPVPSPLFEAFGASLRQTHLLNLSVLFAVMFSGNMLGLIASALLKTEQSAIMLQMFFLLPQILISRLAYGKSYTAQPWDWNEGPFHLVAFYDTKLDSWLQRFMDLISCVFITRFSSSLMEIGEIRNDPEMHEGLGFTCIAGETGALLLLMFLHFTLLCSVFACKEKTWGLR